MSDTIREMVDTLRRQIGEKVEAIKATPEMAEVLSLHRALNGLEDAIPRDRTSLAELFGLGAEGVPGAPARTLLKPWEFTGKKPLEAAKHYLKVAGEPRSIQDIVTAIKDHGGDPGSVDHLKTALTRSTLDVVKVNEDMYGLVEHFPHIKRTSRWSKKKGTGGNGGSGSGETTDEDIDGIEDVEQEDSAADDEGEQQPETGDEEGEQSAEK